jgi:hypothetical protein
VIHEKQPARLAVNLDGKLVGNIWKHNPNFIQQTKRSLAGTDIDWNHVAFLMGNEWM